MDPASLIAAMAGVQTGQLQVAIAAKILRMNADSAASVVQLLNAAPHNMQSLANVAAGGGQKLNISV